MNINTEYDELETEKSPSIFEKFKKWFDWLTINSICLINKDGTVLGYCSRVNMSLDDYKKYVVNSDKINIVDFLISKITSIKNYVPKGIDDVICMAVYEEYLSNLRKFNEYSLSEMAKLYVELLKKKTRFNRYDLELAGLFLNGFSIMTSEGFYIII